MSGDRRQTNLGYFSHAAAREYPGRVAMIDLCGAAPREVSYAELEERLDRFAAMISGLGLAPGDRLAMAVGNRFEFIEVMYGAIRAGVVPVPLNTRQGAEVLADIAGAVTRCEPDQIIDLDDIFAVLEAFAGMRPCDCAAP